MKKWVGSKYDINRMEPMDMHFDYKRFISGICILSLLGWLFPEALWEDGTVMIQNDAGEDITAQYDGEEIEQLLIGNQNIHFESKIGNWIIEMCK